LKFGDFFVLRRQFAVFMFLSTFLTLLAFDQAGPTAALADTEQTTTSSIYLPILFNRLDNSLGPPVFGVQVYGANYLNQLAESGTTWVRVPIRWNVIEPVKMTPAVYNWASTDNLVNQLTSIPGVKIVFTLENNPDWAALHGELGRNGPIKPSELPRMAAFIQAAVERYDGDGIHDAPGSPVVRHWEFYNEPDNQSTANGFRWGEFPVEYAQMLAAVYPAAKAANPQTQILMGGIAYDHFLDQGGAFHRDFMDRVLLAGGGAHFDIMNFHFYPAFGWGDGIGGLGLYEKTQHLRAKLASYGLSKPIMITEAGWHSNNHPSLPSSQESQNRHVVAIFAQTYAADVDMSIWWMLHEAGGSYEYDSGLIRHDGVGTKKQSFYVYQHMVEQMRFAHYIRRLSTAETGSPRLEAHIFDDYTRNRRLYIAWRNPITSNTAEILRIPAHTAVVYDIFGNSQIITDGQDGVVDGHITLAVNGRPIYIETAR
jgi:hypothetical protein